jgi:hypothetical protein
MQRPESSEPKPLSAEELETEQAAELPDREALSLVDLAPSRPLPLDDVPVVEPGTEAEKGPSPL